MPAALALPQCRPDLGVTPESYMAAVLDGVKQYYAQSGRPRESGQAAGAGRGGELGSNGGSTATAFVRLLSTCGSRGSRHAVPSAPPGCLPLPRRPDVECRLLLSIDRERGCEEALATVELAARLRGSGVVGVALTGNPSEGEWRELRPALDAARERGLKVTLEAGEVRCCGAQGGAALQRMHGRALATCAAAAR